MTKEEIQQLVLQRGLTSALYDFKWNEDTKTFSSEELDLVIDFKGIAECTFDTGPDCSFKTGYNCVTII